MESLTGKASEAMAPEQVLAISRALADPRRFSMLQQIAGAATLQCGCLDIHDSLSPATISHHLKELQEAGLITIEREGRGVRMSLQREVWQAYVQTLAAL